MTARAMPGVSAEKSARAGCVVVALRGELDVCTAADGLSALTALAAAGARVVVDLAELAFMDCYSLNEIMAVRMRARRASGDLVLAGPQPIVRRLLVVARQAVRGRAYPAGPDRGRVPARGHPPSGRPGDGRADRSRLMRRVRTSTWIVTAVFLITSASAPVPADSPSLVVGGWMLNVEGHPPGGGCGALSVAHQISVNRSTGNS
jgi:anti-anti-sigma factor